MNSNTGASNANIPIRINYGLIEKLLEDCEPVERPQYELEEIPDYDSIISFQPKLPTPVSRYFAQS